jgi:hypothetical protein
MNPKEFAEACLNLLKDLEESAASLDRINEQIEYQIKKQTRLHNPFNTYVRNKKIQIRSTRKGYYEL